MRRRIVARRDVKAEDPNPQGAVELGQFHRPVKPAQVLFERLGDPHLADRGADRTQAHPAVAEQVAKLSVLRVGQIEHVGPVNRAELDVTDSVSRQHVELLGRVLRDFVGEGTQADHGRCPRFGSRMPGRIELRSMICGGHENSQVLVACRDRVGYDEDRVPVDPSRRPVLM